MQWQISPPSRNNFERCWKTFKDLGTVSSSLGRMFTQHGKRSKLNCQPRHVHEFFIAEGLSLVLCPSSGIQFEEIIKLNWSKSQECDWNAENRFGWASLRASWATAVLRHCNINENVRMLLREFHSRLGITASSPIRRSCLGVTISVLPARRDLTSSFVGLKTFPFRCRGNFFSF